MLRSAVGGEYRNLKLVFTVKDMTSEPIRIHKLMHKTPEDVTLNRNIFE